MKGLISSLIFCLLAVSINAQHGHNKAPWWIAMHDPSANYYDIVAEADSFYHNADSVELLSAPMSAKHYGMWRWHWGTRLDTQGGTRFDFMSAQRDVFNGGAPFCSSSIIWEQLGPFEPVEGTGNGRGTGFIQETWVNPADQDEIFIGSEDGGVFRSVNGGESWTDLFMSTGLPSTQVRAMEVDPNNTDHMYVSVGDNEIGLGLIYTNNGGQSWGATALANTQQANAPRKVVQKVITHFGSFNVAYAYDFDSVYATTDGFQTVTALPASIASVNHDRWMSMDMNPAQNVFFSNRLEVYRWNHQTSTLTDITGNLDHNQTTRPAGEALEYPLVAADENNPNHIYVLLSFRNASNHLSASLQKSTDNGQSFTQLVEFQYHSYKTYREDFRVSKVASQTFYFAGQFRPCRIRHNGTNWEYSNNFSPSISNNDEGVHDDVRDIDIIDNGDGTESVYWSTDGSMNRHNAAGWRNLTKQNINLWMVVGFENFEYSNEIFAGVWHGGNNYRDHQGQWHIYTGGDGGFNAVGSTDRQTLVSTLNSAAFKVNRQTFNTTGFGHPSPSVQGHKYIVVPTKASHGYANHFLMGYNDVYRLNAANGYWWNLTNRNEDIQTIESPREHDSYIVYSVRNRTFEADSSVWISNDHGITWAELPGEPSVDVPVHAIFMHPSDPDQIWVGMGGFVNQKKVFVTYDGGQNWTNVSEAILDVHPISDFELDPVTNILYMSNDVGVFYRDLNATIPEWKCFNKGLPSGHVKQLSINSCTKKILASSYGRGIWQADLVDASEHTAPTVPEFIGNLTVAPGEDFHPAGSIAITGDVTVKGTVYMNEDTKIFVLPGAHLYVEGGTLTNSCGGLWGGVQTIGAYHAATANGYAYPQSDLSKHGLVELVNATIEHAHIGVEVGRADAGNYEGGIIQATNSNFYNNEVAVEMHPYKNRMATAPYAEIPNVGFFKNCAFTTDGVLVDDQVSEPIAQLQLHGISGLRIAGCEFEDKTPWGSTDRSGQANYRIGLQSWDATYSLDPSCGYQSLLYNSPCWNIAGVDSTTFRGYKKAMEVVNINSIVPLTIRGAGFYDNYVNAVIWGTDMAEIYRNAFHSKVIGNNNAAPSVYLIGSTGYTFEENNFIGTTEGANRGLAVFDSGDDMNEIRGNRFEKFDISASMVGDNDGIGTYDGLQYLCNETDETDIDVYVTSGDIGRYQGFCPFIPNNEDPANNQFSAACFGPSQYTLSGVNQQIVYSHLTGEAPQCYSTLLALNPCFDYVSTNGERCPLNDKIHPQVGNDLAHQIKSDIDDFKDWVTSSNSELQSLIASGASDQLVIAAIEDSLPIVSDSVLISAMTLRPQPMEEDSLMIILQLNAPLSAPVMEVLDTEYPALVEAINEYTAQNNLVVSPMVQAELDANANERELKRLHEEIMRYWMAWDTTGGSSDSALTFLQNQSGDFYRLKEARLHYHLGNKTSASSLLQNMEADNLAPEMEAWSEIMDAIAVDSMGVFKLATDSLLETKVRALAAVNKWTMEVVSARGMLNRVFDEPMLLPTIPEPEGGAKQQARTARPFEAFEEVGTDQLAIFPNPASDRIVVEYHLDESVQNARLLVYSLEGRSLGQFELDPRENRKELDVSYLSEGVYVYLLTADGTFIARRKIIVHD